MRLWIISLALLLAGCDMLPELPKLNAPAPIEVKVQHSIKPFTEYRNRVKVTRRAYSLHVPVAQINDDLRFAAMVRVDESRSAENTLRYTDPFAGIELVGEYWKAGLSANDSYYRAELSGNVPLMKSGALSLVGGLNFHNSHNLEPGERRFKKTNVFAGLEYKADCQNRYSLEYQAGNHGADEVNDALLFGWRYLFGCDD